LILDTGYWILDTDTGCLILDAGYWMLDAGIRRGGAKRRGV